MEITFHVQKPADKTKEPSWTAGGTGNPYARSVDKKPGEWRGYQADIWCGGTDGFGGEESFTLVGDGGEMRRFFSTALKCLDAIEESCRERVAKEAERAYLCHECSTWVVLTEFGDYVPHHGAGNGIPCKAAGFQVAK